MLRGTKPRSPRMHITLTGTSHRRLLAGVFMTVLSAAPVAAQPAALTSPGVSHGYAFPNWKQGVSARLYDPGEADKYDKRFEVLRSWGISMIGENYWWWGLEAPGVRPKPDPDPLKNVPRVVTSSPSPVSC